MGSFITVIEFFSRIDAIFFYYNIWNSFASVQDAWSYFSKFSFLFHLKNHHYKDVNLKFQLEWSDCLAVYYSCLYHAV